MLRLVKDEDVMKVAVMKDLRKILRRSSKMAGTQSKRNNSL